MGRYIVRRLLYLLLTVLIITLAAFLIFYKLPPGDPALAFAGKTPSPSIIAQVEKQFGLDKPFHEQYLFFVRNLFLGDQYGWPGLGFSFDTRSPVRRSCSAASA